VAGGDEELGRVGWVGCAGGVTSYAGVELAVGGVHGELDDGASGDVGLGDGLGCCGVGGADDEVAFEVDAGEGVVGEVGGGYVAGRVRIVCWERTYGGRWPWSRRGSRGGGWSLR